MIAPWLQHHLERIGAWNADGVTRTVRARRCPSCGAMTLRGLDDIRCAGAATTDGDPLTTLGEAVALLAGRTTYTLRRTAGRLELDHRHQWAVAAHPPGAGEYDVVAEHVCGQATAAALTTTSRLRPPTVHQEIADAPPY